MQSNEQVIEQQRVESIVDRSKAQHEPVTVTEPTDVVLPAESQVDYTPFAEELARANPSTVTSDFFRRLTARWISAYHQQTARPINPTEIWLNGFGFLIDLEGADHGDGRGPQPPGVYMRTFSAYGLSKPTSTTRSKHDSRLRGWMGKTDNEAEPPRDKGHFIAHSLGGAIVASEVNVFLQRRNLNRGWSAEGKIFRQMESQAQQNPGSLYFHRAIYLIESTIPNYLEVGLCTPGKPLTTAVFEN